MPVVTIQTVNKTFEYTPFLLSNVQLMLGHMVCS
jgi:hypothetical protein